MWTRLLDSVSNKLAFFPPQPPTYQLVHHGDGEREAYLQPMLSGLKKVVRCEVLLLESRRQQIVAVHVPAVGGGGAAVPWTLLHSHGNAVDLGEMLPLYEELSRLLRCNILAYDYSGYGQSGGTPSVSATLSDIKAAYGCLQQRYGRQPQDLVLYGQSVGSGPTCHLAAELPGLAGAVLHSPFLSGMRVLNPGWSHWPAWADIYPNLRLLPRVECPVLVMHGTHDDVIDVAHGKKLHALCKRPSAPLWAEGYNHQNLESSPEYVPRLRQFLAECWGKGYREHLRAGGVKL